MVRATSLATEAIVAAIASGDFYASTGVELTDYAVTGDSIALHLPSGYRYHVPVPGELRYVERVK